jgi:nucleotide-binding universal stress UspA family protein
MIAMRNVLVATDFGAASTAALRYARELARPFGATLHVLHVAETGAMSTLGVEMYVPLPSDFEADGEREARRRLDGFLNGPARDVRTIPVVVPSISPARTIIDYAAEHDIDLIVMGTHGRGAVAQFVMGKVAERVVRGAACPVLTVKEGQRDFVMPDVWSVARDTFEVRS